MRSGNRRELLEWLGRNAPLLAELYKGAVSLLYGSRIPGFSRFVSRAVREFRNRLPGVISGTTSTGRLDYKGRMDQIASVAKKAGVNWEGKGQRSEQDHFPVCTEKYCRKGFDRVDIVRGLRLAHISVQWQYVRFLI